ncbi:hypothetical protein [Romboutsia ilealis]|uniref:hypothetical protein n=1 Tax=Romboutsia ilealis TaxID=1115758 RepID=UPI0026F3B614|nr:hypothetical protein [Romboutsia ilealis]
MSYNLLNLCKENLSKGVVKCFEGESTLFTMCPVINVTGNATAYNQVNELFTVEKRELGQDLSSIQEMTTKKVVEPLEIFANSVKVDRALCMMSEDNVRAMEAELQARAMARNVHKEILNKLKENAGVVVTSRSSMPNADEVAEAMDNMRFIEGSMLMLCNAKTNRHLQKQAVAEGFTYGQVDSFGRKLYQFNNVPVQTTCDLADGEVVVIYFNVSEGVALATNGGLKSYDLGLKGVFYVTDFELVGVPVIKNTKAVAIVKPNTRTKTK